MYSYNSVLNILKLLYEDLEKDALVFRTIDKILSEDLSFTRIDFLIQLDNVDSAHNKFFNQDWLNIIDTYEKFKDTFEKQNRAGFLFITGKTTLTLSDILRELENIDIPETFLKYGLSQEDWDTFTRFSVLLSLSLEKEKLNSAQQYAYGHEKLRNRISIRGRQ